MKIIVKRKKMIRYFYFIILTRFGLTFFFVPTVLSKISFSTREGKAVNLVFKI